MWIDYRGESRKRYGYESKSGNACLEQINCGSFMRMADAMELMAKRYQELIDERDRYKRDCQEQREAKWKVRHQIAGLRGVITKMRKKSRCDHD